MCGGAVQKRRPGRLVAGSFFDHRSAPLPLPDHTLTRALCRAGQGPAGPVPFGQVTARAGRSAGGVEPRGGGGGAWRLG